MFGGTELLARAKRLTTQVLGSASKKYGNGLSSEQEVVGRLADMAIEVYALESAILRAEKMQQRGGGNAATALDIVSVFAADAADRLGISAKNALARLKVPMPRPVDRALSELRHGPVDTSPRAGHRRRRDRGRAIAAVTVDQLTGIIGQEWCRRGLRSRRIRSRSSPAFTGDQQWITRRRRSRAPVSRRFGGPRSAHGFFTLALASRLLRDAVGSDSTARAWDQPTGSPRSGVSAAVADGSRVRGRCTLRVLTPSRVARPVEHPRRDATAR